MKPQQTPGITRSETSSPPTPPIKSTHTAIRSVSTFDSETETKPQNDTDTDILAEAKRLLDGDAVLQKACISFDRVFDDWDLDESNQRDRAHLIEGALDSGTVRHCMSRLRGHPTFTMATCQHQHWDELFMQSGFAVRLRSLEVSINNLEQVRPNDVSGFQQLDKFERLAVLIQHALPPFDPSLIQHPRPSAPSESQSAALETATMTRVRNNFTKRFHGPAVKRLLAHLDEHEYSMRQYALSTQSSTGSCTSRSTACHPTKAQQQAQTTRTLEPHPFQAPVSSSASAKGKTPVLSARKDEEDNDYYYSRVLPIIQSSGFGKTKMCIHLSFVQPGMLMCLRDLPKSAAVSFPPRDTVVADYFDSCRASYFGTKVTPDAPEFQSNRLHATMAYFLAAYCSELHRLVSHLMQLSSCFTNSNPDRLYAPTSVSQQQHRPTCTGGHNASRCWNSIVYALAFALHKKSDFLSDLQTDASPKLCPHSQLGHLGLLATVDGSATASSPPSPPPVVAVDAIDNDAMVTLTQLTSQCARTDMLKRICDTAESELEAYCQTDEGSANAGRTEELCVARVLRPAVARLEQLVPEKLRDRAYFFLALDEFQTYSAMLPYLRRAWKIARPQRSWILLLDTNSSIHEVAGPHAMMKSTRTENGSSRLVQPFTIMPSNVNLTRHDKRSFSNNILTQICSMRQLNDMIPRIGRPLWNDTLYCDLTTIVRAGSVVSKIVKPPSWVWPSVEQTEQAEQDKERKELMLRLNQTDSDEFNNIMALALQRVPLEQSALADRSTWKSFAACQVSNHLRYLGDYHTETDVIESHVPSEPSLSVAAAWSFRLPVSKVEWKWSIAILTVASARTSIGLNIGEEGEEGVRLLCSMAADFAFKAARVGAEALDQAYEDIMGLVTVGDWLQQLLGYTTGDFEQDFVSWSKRHWLNFKHVARYGAQIQAGQTLPRCLLLELWIRHAAVRGVVNQKGWDLLIPIYESESKPTGDQIFSSAKLSYIAVQVKNWTSKPDVPNVLGPPMSKWPGADYLPDTLELFLDLRGAPKLPHTWTIPRASSPAAFGRRYRLVVPGLNRSVFPLIDKLDSEARRRLPTLFGLPKEGIRNRKTDSAAYLRQLTDDELVEDLKQAEMDKKGNLIMTNLAPLVPEQEGSELASELEGEDTAEEQDDTSLSMEMADDEPAQGRSLKRSEKSDLVDDKAAAQGNSQSLTARDAKKAKVPHEAAREQAPPNLYGTSGSSKKVRIANPPERPL